VQRSRPIRGSSPPVLDDAGGARRPALLVIDAKDDPVSETATVSSLIVNSSIAPAQSSKRPAHKGRSVKLLIADQSIRVIDLEGQPIRELRLDPQLPADLAGLRYRRCPDTRSRDVLTHHTAEGGGFEPPDDVAAVNGFQDRRIQPLCHPSGTSAMLRAGRRGQVLHWPPAQGEVAEWLKALAC
jgi:hypothetical protein